MHGFPRFLDAFELTHALENHRVPAQLELTPDLATVVDQLGGKTFDDGLYRVYPAHRLVHATDAAIRLFPEFRGRAVCFACDWMGNQFVQDLGRAENGRPLVSLLEPGSGEALEIPASVIEFHEDILTAHVQNNVLTQAMRVDWLEVDPAPVGPTECIGYRVPLFLNGADETSNLERTDMEAYLEITAQLRARAKGMADGSDIGGVDIF